MNKLLEALPLAEEALDMVVSCGYGKARERVENRKALATIRAARAQEPVEFPYPCGWENLYSHIIEDGAYLARSLVEDEPVTAHQRHTVMRMIERATTLCKLYAAPVRTKDLTDIEDLQDAVTKALKKAFQLGQTYWQQADSESHAANKRADVTQELYWKLEDDTRAVIAKDREKNK